MLEPLLLVATVGAVFVLAGLVKGVVGLGLPTIAMGLLGLVMLPAEAAAILLLPSFVTNIWQLLAGPNVSALTRRLWPMMVAVFLTTLASSGLITSIYTTTVTASEGLNLQMLGTLINVDLPWNPTRLEQRKGRIQRIGQARSAINILNLRYSPSVEDKVHKALAGRLEEIRKMFGQIPDVLSDVWVKVALDEMEEASHRLDEVKPFHAFDGRYSRVEDVSGWDECSQVLNRQEKLAVLRKGWVS